MLPDAPFLNTQDSPRQAGLSSRLKLCDVDTSSAFNLGTTQGQRLAHATDIDVFQVAVFADKVENYRFRASIAQPLQFLVIWTKRIFVINSIEQELAFLKTPTR